MHHLFHFLRQLVQARPLPTPPPGFPDQYLANDQPENSTAVLVELNGGWQPGLLIERAISGVCIVFIPGSPHTVNGSVYVLPPYKVLLLNMPINKLTDSIQLGGKGLSAYVSNVFDAG